MTLVEALLVLCLLVLLAALVLPSLGGPLERRRLRRAADQVRAAWIAARVEAMRSGCAQRFVYAPGGCEFSILPETQQYAAVDPLTGMSMSGESAVGLDGSAAAGLSGALASDVVGAPGRRLPEGVAFASPDGLPLALGDDPLPDETAASDDPRGDRFAPDARSIFFFPDGTTSTDSLVLESAEGYRIELRLRGLTGVASVGEVTRWSAASARGESPP